MRLDRAQSHAYHRALTDPVSYIWGPPGCGKTRTLGTIVQAAFQHEKRLLVCSNTNRAVDQILYHICETLGREHPGMKSGRIVRVGRIADDKLKQDYASYVTIDGIVERRSAELKLRKTQIESEVARIDVRTADAQRLIDQFQELDRVETMVASLQGEASKAADRLRKLQADLESSNATLRALEQELAARDAALFKLFKRSEASIRQEMEANRASRSALLKEVASTKQRHSDVQRNYEIAQARRDQLRTELKGRDRRAAERLVAQYKAQRDSLVAELREIETKISRIREEILRDARVLGATCTKSYLSVKEVGQADMVIIDEASMVILPMIWFCAGLARERVVVCGDFRQIPPIVPTNQQEIFDVLGHDIFAHVGLDNVPEGDDRLVMLDTQYRMHGAICDLIKDPMYQRRLRTAVGRELANKWKPPSPFDGVLTIVDTADLWPFETVNAFFSRFNLMHALLVRNLAWHFRQEGYLQNVHTLGVCTPYAAQARLIRKLLESEALNDLVQVGTVHSFQGDERHSVVLEIPESHGGGRMLGRFVQGVPPEHVGARLINVAVSRAKDHLVVLANLTHLDRLLPSSSLLRGILHQMQEQGHVVSGRRLLELRPVEHDLQGLLGRIELDIDVKTLGLFNETTFDDALKADIGSAQESIVIFSGFVTPRRVAEIGDLLRMKVAQGVRIRCVTRPPKLNGTMDPALGKEALDMLEGIDCVVDCRARIHEKVILIDKAIVWHGSLNALSHSHRTDESMTRLVNSGYAQSIAGNMSKLHMSSEKAVKMLATGENPRCSDCDSRTVYAEGKFGPFFYCENDCGWRASLKSVERRSWRQSR